ncbi:MAG TPA: universal stress protein [Steroidobacteraceae bacterium]
MFSKILVPVDGSEISNRGLAEAIKMTTTLGSRLYLVHIVNELIPDFSFGSAQYVTALMDSTREQGKAVLAQAGAEARKYGVPARTDLLETIGDRTADLIVGHAKKIGAELIVMGTHGRRGLRRLTLGSDAEQVVRLAEVPVLLIRGEETSDVDSLCLTGKPATTVAANCELG